MKAWVITVSDRSARGEREDVSGPMVRKMLLSKGYTVGYEVIPDDLETIRAKLETIADNNLAELVLTTGGTGFAPRDVTPEATALAADKEVPGIAEAIRFESMRITPRAMLSRAKAVIRKGTLIVNLPGSPKGAMEALEVFINVIPHGLSLLRGEKADG